MGRGGGHTSRVRGPGHCGVGPPSAGVGALPASPSCPEQTLNKRLCGDRVTSARLLPPAQPPVALVIPRVPALRVGGSEQGSGLFLVEPDSLVTTVTSFCRETLM